MGRLAKFVRRLLARRDYLVYRVEPGIPPTLVEYLQALLRRKHRPDFVICFDTNAFVQAEILGLFSSGKVRFVPPLDTDRPELGRPEAAASQLLVEIDPEVYPLQKIATHWPWIFESGILVLRCQLGFFWAGDGDLTEINRFLAAHGYQPGDVLDFSKPGLLNGPLGRVVLVFEKNEPPNDPHRHYRIQQARAFLSRPLARQRDLRWLAGRGSFGFTAGIFNPGALAEDDRTLLLANGENEPWARRKASQTTFLASCVPTLIRLDASGKVAAHTRLAIANLPSTPPCRFEDFRLLRFRGEVLSNHAVVALPSPSASPDQPLPLAQLTTRIALSRVEPESGRLVFLGFPGIDASLRQTEKNWAMFVQQDELYLIYSFSPYRLLRLTRWPALDFTTILTAELPLPFAASGQSVRNSINPVDYDSTHWLHVVHMVYPGKQYVFWAVLIDKATHRPVQVSARPLARGWPSSPAAIIYACSVVLQGSTLHLFAGLDDSSTARWSIPRAHLDAEWVPLHSHPDKKSIS